MIDDNKCPPITGHGCDIGLCGKAKIKNADAPIDAKTSREVVTLSDA
jgi:hypothetical protein